MPHDCPVRLYSNARLWSGQPASAGMPATQPPPVGAIAEQAGRIVALGGPEALQRRFPDAEVHDLDGRLVTPGLIDCHTHLVHEGNRADEIERRLAGESYQDIARSGGGIRATVTATRAASTSQLIASALPRLDALLADGLTTIEIKSGYGLDLATEVRMLQAARALAAVRHVTVVTSYLGAHVLPQEHANDATGYVERVCADYLPAIVAGGWADAFDAYGDALAFSPAQIERMFAAARTLGLPVKLHADQFSDQGGAALAARHGALSADHLEYTDAAGVTALAAAGTVAVLLPGAFHFLREPQRPPVAALRAAGVPMAVATDCNPGTSPLASLLVAMNLAAIDFGLSVEECLLGVTSVAARALGRQHDCGTLGVGLRCDLAVWNVARPAELVLGLGLKPLHCRIWQGRPEPAKSTG
jgi:imidazolonepropionase